MNRKTFKTIKMGSAINYFGKQARTRCMTFKGKPCYKVYLTMCIVGMAYMAGFHIESN